MQLAERKQALIGKGGAPVADPSPPQDAQVRMGEAARGEVNVLK